MIKKNASPKPFPPRADGTSAPALRLATPREACAYGHFSHTKLYDYINEGKVDAYKRDRSTMIDLDSIDRMHAALPKIEPKRAARDQASTS
ncbi:MULTISPECIES: helix-turn-helix domain-containing protein [unclassified Bradyrhizobium]